MLLARVSFIPQHDHEEAELIAVAEAYLVALLKNGQICGDYVKGWTEGILSAYVYLSHRTAIQGRYLSQWGEKQLNSLQLQFGAHPEWEILDDAASWPVPKWNSAATLFLFTHSMISASPLRHGDRGTPIPLHLLPISDRLREDVFLWGRSFARYDGLWHESDSLEIAAYREIADLNSQLCRSGRELAAATERVVEKPVYFYLLRHFGTKYGDPSPCPGCGGDWWSESSPFPSSEPFHQFHYRCDACRLVSHQPVVDGPAFPRIEPVASAVESAAAVTESSAQTEPSADEAVGNDDDSVDESPKSSPESSVPKDLPEAASKE